MSDKDERADMNCIDCKFFNRFNRPAEHLGACAVKLPWWLMRNVEAEMCVSRTVRVDDGCDLHASKEAK